MELASTVPLGAGSQKVLIVEDDDQSREELRLILELEGFDVRVARDGSEGIGLVLEFRPDVVVMDLVLPGINGFEAAGLLKADSDTSAIPLVAVTGSWLGAQSDRLRRVGFDSALRKPFAPARLIEVLRQVLRSVTEPRVPADSSAPGLASGIPSSS